MLLILVPTRPKIVTRAGRFVVWLIRSANLRIPE
jgi:hypothetical protein